MPSDRFLKLSINKKETVHQAIINEMKKHTYEHINVSNIVREADISRGSFYQYFINKDDFYFYILEFIGHNKQKYMDINYLQNHSIGFIKKLEHIVHASIEFSKSHPNYVSIGIQLYASAHAKIKSFVSKSIHDMQQLFESWLSQDITYQHMKNKSLFCQYIASTITYQTQFALKQKSLEALENDLMILIKILEGGITNV